MIAEKGAVISRPTHDKGWPPKSLLQSPLRQSSTAMDRFRIRHWQFGLVRERVFMPHFRTFAGCIKPLSH
jgi:hypothetical protein